MSTAEKVYAMLGNENLWDAALSSHQALTDKGVPHAVAGGVAVCLHGYQRNTVDLDILVRAEDSQLIKDTLEASGWSWEAANKEFKSESGVLLHCLLAGDRAGTGSDVRLPDPGELAVVTQLEGLPVLTLERLIEAKLACGQSNARRMHKDFADVVELIAMHNLQRSFSRKLEKSLQKTFLELVARARGE